jgi:uncharacterized Ntn-hydrolase superfamily protein
MTYTIVGRCPKTSRLGVGIATYSLAVGGYCPLVKAGVAAVSSQAFVNPKLRERALTLLGEGASPQSVLDDLAGMDPFFDYRQVGIVSADGQVACHSGGEIRPWRGHVLDEDLVSMGNGLEGAHVAEAMADGFRSTKDEELEERLLQALESGCAAGGQGPLIERSAGLITTRTDPSGMGVDLRVDAHDTAVQELRRAWEVYRPYVPYYDLRANQPDQTPPQEQWPPP